MEALPLFLSSELDEHLQSFQPFLVCIPYGVCQVLQSRIYSNEKVKYYDMPRKVRRDYKIQQSKGEI